MIDSFTEKDSLVSFFNRLTTSPPTEQSNPICQHSKVLTRLYLQLDSRWKLTHQAGYEVPSSQLAQLENNF